MSAPCFENDAKDKLKLPIGVTKAFMNEALEHIKGGKSYPEALDSLAESSGLRPETINSILRREPKVFSITKQAIAQAGKMRQIRDAAEGFADQLKNDGRLRGEPGAIAKAWDLQRRVALSGHSVVFPGTHMRNWAVQIPTEAGMARMAAFWRAETNVWKYGGEAGRARYEMDMSLMQLGDRYDFWKQSGLDIQPGKLTPGDILRPGRESSGQSRRFDALKPARYTAAEQAWSKLDPALKQGDTGKAVGAQIARDINYATGSVMKPVGQAATAGAKFVGHASAFAGETRTMMSSKLFFAKQMDAIFQPISYLAKSVKGMTEAERASSNIALGRWANTVATHLSILGVNYAVAKALGAQLPNLTDPTKSDFWRMKVGGQTVPFSPMLEALRLPIVEVATMLQKGGTPGDKAKAALWNAAHPMFHTLYEQASGKDFMGRPVPSIRNLISPVKSTKSPESVAEYASTRATPIALSGAIKSFYDSLRHGEVDASMATSFIKAALTGASSGIAGTHVYEQEQKSKQSRGSAKVQPIPLY